jgi:carbon storage regulator
MWYAGSIDPLRKTGLALPGNAHPELNPIRPVVSLQDRKAARLLVLTRTKEEKIVIGDDVTVMIVDIIGGKVRLGIEAPRHIAVHRQEVYDAIQRRAQERASPESQAPEMTNGSP